MKNQWYEITDIDIFIKSTRVLAYSSFGLKEESKEQVLIDYEDLSKEQKKEIESCLPQKESLAIAKEYLKETKKNGKVVFRFNEKLYMDLIQALNLRLTSNILNNMSKKGLIETAFDSELNDFVFWTKDDNNKNSEAG